MKKLILILLPLLLLVVLAAHLHTGRPGEAVRAETADGRPQLPVACPADMWRQLSRLPGVEWGQRCEADIPAGLPWQSGEGEPEIGDPHARKGGRVRLSNVGPFPANWLAFGSPTPQFFHYNLFTTVEMPLVGLHPVTRREIPGLAEAWAQQGRQLWFRLDPQARYSNGRPVRAADVALGLLLRARVGVGEWGSFRALAEELCVYGEHVLSVRLREGVSLPLAAAQMSALLHPAEPGFYAEAAGDYRERYRNRIPPTTGAYTVGRVERGRLVELVRVKDWWAKDKRFYRHTCNVDAIEHHFLTDEAQAWEFFLRGRLDVLQTRNLSAWQNYLDGDAAVEQGRIIPHRFAADYPMPPYGIALNAAQIPNLQLRRGIMQALDMDKAVALIFRGEAERLTTFHSGYGELSPTDTPTYAFDPAAARACFAAAGYTQAGADGILQRADGERLSLRFSCSPSEKISTLASVLVQSAAACGLELVPEPLSWQQWSTQLREGRHELTFWAGMAASPLPEPARIFASSAAVGDEAPFALRDAAVDAAITAYEQAVDDTTRAAALAALDCRVQELALWLPGWKENRVYLAAWQHVRFPDVPACRFSTPGSYEVMEAHLYWVEDDARPAAP